MDKQIATSAAPELKPTEKAGGCCSNTQRENPETTAGSPTGASIGAEQAKSGCCCGGRT